MTHDPGISTAYAVSSDSGEHWTAEGAWEVEPGVHRIPLPLPMDGLKAINVYVIATDTGLTLVDGGWAIPVARDLLESCLRQIGAGFADIDRFLVTHIHRDHFTMATVLGRELGIDVALGEDERAALDLLNNTGAMTENPFHAVLRSAGAHAVAEKWERLEGDDEGPDPMLWQYPTTWLDGDHEIGVGARTLDAVHTPGHTPGHYVFADRAAELLFAGDHVLPTITPSIGFTVPPVEQPLMQFMASLTKVRELPDLRILPAHGPIAPSSHERVDALLAHHEERLADSLAALPAAGTGTAGDGTGTGDGRARTAYGVAGTLGWTRHLHAFETLDVFSQGMAAMETKAHLDLLVARGQATGQDSADGVAYTRV